MYSLVMLFIILFPTRVGVIPEKPVAEKIDETFPHTGGGDPQLYGEVEPKSVFSPHGWG